ncbi:MAG: type 4a pilus biogenesis protein PilO [Acidobacteria bacterium]|jgi:type IV pilus assembly protein PilO|nr:type 4a pilus biogenesis protein PilO [Acidobacteriota bacterium]
MDLSLNKWPWYTQAGAFVALAICGVAAFYYLYATPVIAEQTEQQVQLDALRVEIRKGMAIAGKLPQFRAQVAELQKRLDGLRAVLPEEKDFGDLLRSLQTLAMQSNLTIRLFTPAPVVAKQMHAEWPINVELDGTYHSLGMFFDRISRFSRIINIGNVRIRAKDKPDPNTSIQVAFVATTFVLVDAAKPDTGVKK